MDLKIKRSQHGRAFRLEVQAEYNDAELAALQSSDLKRFRIFYQPTTSDELKLANRSTGPLEVLDTVVGFFFSAGKNIVIDAYDLRNPYILEGPLGPISRAEDEIRFKCEILSTQLEATTLYQGQEQVIQLGRKGRSTVVARAEPPVGDE